MQGKNIVVVTECFGSQGIYRIFKKLLSHHIIKDVTHRNMKMELGDGSTITFMSGEQNAAEFRGYSKPIDLLVLHGTIPEELAKPLIYKTRIMQDGEIVVL